ncbi:hypothetical protein [Dictyobacter kobayashii]|uniref:Uncharacterized protein n=1 Tax=Dictyobacter kobayashii TaxID=2014872 RepID=A0A402AUA5_9CHLR|nr:hypothetical protein [Dictyobacter kobayashii]GCE22698.1 hypothetical protein KDK_64980 [Dictyobacter kobayashii]
MHSITGLFVLSSLSLTALWDGSSRLIVSALALLVGFSGACWIAYRKRNVAPWHSNAWLLLPTAVLFISPVVLFHIPLVFLLPLYLTLLVGVYFMSKRSAQLWYRNPLLLILLILLIAVLFKGTLLKVFVIGAIVLGSLNFIFKKLFSR